MLMYFLFDFYFCFFLVFALNWLIRGWLFALKKKNVHQPEREEIKKERCKSF